MLFLKPLSEVGFFFFFNTLEIYQGLESSVGSHHRGTESKVHRWPGPWAFWSSLLLAKR